MKLYSNIIIHQNIYNNLPGWITDIYASGAAQILFNIVNAKACEDECLLFFTQKLLNAYG